MKQKTFTQVLAHLRKDDKRISADVFFRTEEGYWTARLLRSEGTSNIIESGDGSSPQEAMRSCVRMWNEVHGKEFKQNTNNEECDTYDVDYEEAITAFDIGADF